MKPIVAEPSLSPLQRAKLTMSRAVTPMTSELMCVKPPTKKRKRMVPTEGGTIVESITSMEGSDELDAAAKKRLQYKMYQRRHRAKQQEKTRRLEEQVAQLTQQIADLEKDFEATDLQMNPRRLVLDGPPAQLVQKYLSLFERGYSSVSGDRQETFVRSMMLMDVQGPQYRGVDEVVRQWRLYAEAFEEVRLTSRKLHVEPLDAQQTLVTVKITLNLQFRPSGVCLLLPSTRDHDDLVEALVASPLVVEGSLQFLFEATNCVGRFNAEMDFVDALARSAGSFSNACICVEGALLDLSTGYINSVISGADDVPVKDEVGTSPLDIAFILSEA